MTAGLPGFLKTPAARKIRLATLVSAIFFSAGAAAQYWFIQHQSTKTAHQEFATWTVALKDELMENGGWNLKKFRQSEWSAPGCFLYTTNGLLLDVEGFVPGFLSPVSLPESLPFGTPSDFTSAAGEKWRVLAKKLDGGTVLLETESPTNTSAQTDSLFSEAMPIFGSSISQAAKIRPRDINRNLDYAVIDNDGHVLFAIGGVPLQMLNAPALPSKPAATDFTADGKAYTVLSTTISNAAGMPLGILSIPRDGTPAKQALRSSLVFNVCLGLGLWAVFGIISSAFLLKEDRDRRAQPISLEIALSKGEGQDIEFKGGTVDTQLAACIASFANTNPGCIFIGVLDNGGVAGLRERSATEKDDLLRKIHDIAKRIDPRVLPIADFLEHDGKIVLRLFITRGPSPPYVLQGTVYRRYLATVSQATAEDIRAMVNST